MFYVIIQLYWSSVVKLTRFIHILLPAFDRNDERLLCKTDLQQYEEAEQSWIQSEFPKEKLFCDVNC